MSNMFEESPASIRNPNAHLLMQPGESDYRKRSPLIEEESFEPQPRVPRQVSGTDFASALTRKQDFTAKPETGWKLFSPSTWAGLRNTAWGRKKAAKRQIASMTSRMNAFGGAIKGISPRGGLFSNASWDTKGPGTPYTAATSTPDPRLSTNASYGMSRQAADQWQVAALARVKLQEAEQGSESWKQLAGVINLAGDKSGMSRDSFRALTGMGRRNAGPQVAMADDHEAGENVDGHTWMESPGDDDQDDGDGIPSIVRDVLGPKAAGAGGAGGAPGPTARTSLDSDDIDIDMDDDDEQAMFGGKYTKEQIAAATHQMQRHW